MTQGRSQQTRPRHYLKKVSRCMMMRIGLFTLRVVVADGEPSVHAWEDCVVCCASLNGTSDLMRALPDDLSEMEEIMTILLRALLTVEVGEH
jgi:hypothetical protein